MFFFSSLFGPSIDTLMRIYVKRVGISGRSYRLLPAHDVRPPTTLEDTESAERVHPRRFGRVYRRNKKDETTKKKDAGGQGSMSKQPSRRPRLGEHFVFKIRKANILINVSDRALGRISSFCCFLFGSFFLFLFFFLVRFPLVVLIRSRLLDSRPLLLGAFLLLRN